MTKANKTVTEMHPEQMKRYNAQLARHQRRKRHLKQRLVTFSVIVVIIFGALAIYHINQRSIQAEKEEQYNILSEQMAALEAEELELHEEINLLNDDEYILDIARTRYFMSKKGDLIFQVQDTEERSY